MNKAEKDSLIWNIRQLLHLEKDIEIISDESIIHLKVMGKPFCLYIKSLTYAGNPYPQNTTRAQLPRREEFETIKKDDSIFLFLGYDEANKVFACWDPVRTKERLNERQYVSFFSRLNLQKSVTHGNILSSTLQNDFKYVLFKLNDLANFLLHITEYFPNIKFEHATIAVSKNTNGILSKIEDDNSVKLLIDELISMNDDVSDLILMSSCMNEFGDFYNKMTLKDWHHIVKTYRDKKKSHIFDIEEETDTTPFFAAEPIEDRFSSDEVAYNTINENEIEHVYVGVPSADPYIETEYEPTSSNDNDVKDNVEIDPVVGSSAINDFFPLFGVTLGKTTWKDAENLGAEVEIFEKGPARTTEIEKVDFWDHDGVGIFTSLYWTIHYDTDFPPLWKEKGFSWSHSYDEWIDLFEKLGYSITIIKEPILKVWKGRTVFCAEFEALSSDDLLEFRLDFDFGEDGYYTSSPKTLYSISVDYNAILSEESEDIEESVVDEKKNVSSSDKLFYDNNGVGYKEDYGVLVRYPNGGQYDTIEVPEFITEINTWAFKEVKASEILLPDGIQVLNDFLFEKCHNLRTITLKSNTPDDILIKDNAFYGFDIENCVLRVPFDAIADYKCDERFDGFKYITAIEGSRCLMYDDDGTEIIGCSAENCENLVIPEGVTSIKEEAFDGNEKISSISFPESLETIGNSAFSGCTGITKITLNEELEDIGYNAFRGTKLTKIKIPYNVNFIGASAFNCEIEVDPMNTKFDDLDGILYDYNETGLIIYPSSKRDEHYDVPDDIIKISYFAFEDSCLHSISLPKSIKTLETHIFNGCANLTLLKINVEDPEEIEIDENCFEGFDKGLCKLIVPKGCKAKYSSHTMFKDFLTIEEMNTRKEEFKKASVPIVPEMLDKIFVNKVTSYKYFWFMSIISLAKEKKTPTILYKDIIIRMAAMAWPIVFEYEIDLGKGDMISKYLYDILKKTTLIKNVSSKYVEEYLNTYYHSYGIGNILEPLLKNVPYRFLSPWIKYTTDEEVIEKSNSDDCACLYALRKNEIVLNEEWWEYIKKNYTKICNSSECSFVTYLKLNNNHSKLVKFMSKGWSIQ